MKKQFTNYLKLHLVFITVFIINTNVKAQESAIRNDNRLYTSIDLTQYGSQIRIAYDFYTRNKKCIGFSIAQVGGINKESSDASAYYLDLSACRINVGFRFTNYLYNSKRANIFGLLSAGASYNTLITGDHLVLPSLHLGMGVDFKIVKGSGVRLEAGYGSPYLVSIGYFFKF